MDVNRYTPSYSVKQKHLIKLSDYSTEEMFEILYATKSLKNKFVAHDDTKILSGTTVALLFGDTSLRMRSAIEIGVKQLGGETVNLPYSQEDMNAGENIADIVNAISRYGVGAIITRGIPHSELIDYCQVSSIPIINSHNEAASPIQAAADLYTIWEKCGRVDNLKLAYVGKSSSVAKSLATCAVKCGMEVVMAMPIEFSMNREEINGLRQFGKITITDSAWEAARGADIIYTDNYHYHGTTNTAEKELLLPYQVNIRLMSAANRGAIFMHPLPATRGLEVTEDIIDGKNSVVYDQAENRLHAVKALLALLVK
ncbi:MAG: ornithine carbamoyltransferase [Clostridia bacterium]|nr:ornithine carbamoyltransferase [Clostridia bacterium]